MIKNYFKIAWRNVVKSKGYSFINIGGLAIGMAVAIIIGLWIYDELSFNKTHKNYSRIAMVMERITMNGEGRTGKSMPMPIAAELRSAYPGDFSHVVMSSFEEEHTFAYEEIKINKEGLFMESDAPEMLTLTMLKGTRAGLKDPSSILLSESFAKVIFGETDPINKILQIDKKENMKVTGVYKDIPHNSDFADLAYIGTWDMYMTLNPWATYWRENWGNNFTQVIVQLSPVTDFEKIAPRIRDVKLSHSVEQDKALKPEIFLHPMSKWHLYSEFKNGINTGGQVQYVWMFSIIGAFVLLLACINFMNLSTARSEKRAKEVGIRKAVGSARRQLIYQFLSESVLIALLSFILSLGIVELILPWFNGVADKKMDILWTSPVFWLLSGGFIIITGLIAGSYPAFYLSSFRPVKVLKGVFRAGRFAAIPRKTLVVIQFTVSITLIIGTIIVFRQISFAKDRPVGYDREGLIYLKIQTDDIHAHYDAFRNELLETGVVTDIAESNGSVLEIRENTRDFTWKGKGPDMKEGFGNIRVSHDYGKTMGWQFVKGRDFSRAYPSDSFGLVINEAAAKLMKFENPVGETIRHNEKDYKVLGVVKDMVMRSPFDPPRQSIFSILQWRGGAVSIKIKPTVSAAAALPRIETIFKKYAPGIPFDYKFADLEYEKKFGAVMRIGNLSVFFAILTILISCLGLFGLASFVAEQRTKEIGVRKVLGASVFSVWRLLSKDFLGLVILSCLISIPIAYHFLQEWLQKYEYRTDMSWWVFIVAIVGALIITVATISFQAIKAAVTNPVKSLRTE